MHDEHAKSRKTGFSRALEAYTSNNSNAELSFTVFTGRAALLVHPLLVHRPLYMTACITAKRRHVQKG